MNTSSNGGIRLLALLTRNLEVLQNCGWEAGYRKLETPREPHRGAPMAFNECFLGWMDAERNRYKDACRHFRNAKMTGGFVGWASLGEAYVALQKRDHGSAVRFLKRASQAAISKNCVLLATVDHLSGILRYQERELDEALRLQLNALEKYGANPFGRRRVLDELGTIYAARSNYQAARDFYCHALTLEKTLHDDAGLAVTNGNLGRLYLSWGSLDQAEFHLLEDLKISQRIGDVYGESKMCHDLGQVALARAEGEHIAGRNASALRHLEKAGGLFERGMSLSQESGWTTLNAENLTGRALVNLYLGERGAGNNSRRTVSFLKNAAANLREAEKVFKDRKSDSGMARVSRAKGQMYRSQKKDGAEKALRQALTYFIATGRKEEEAVTRIELARTQRAARTPKSAVSQELVMALETAESCRRAHLVRKIELELEAVDEAAFRAQIYHRVRGRSIAEDTTSLISGTREPATVLFLDIEGSTDYARGRDPEEVMMTLNQMMAELWDVLRRHRAQVVAFRGDGFLALLRGVDNAVRAVDAGLDLFKALEEFNQPRKVLEQPLFKARIGIATGEVFLGNVGTYDKMDYTAIGTAANLGARLEASATAGIPRINRQTYDQVKDRFVFKNLKGTEVKSEHGKGLAKEHLWAWDVTGRSEKLRTPDVD